MSVFRPHDLLFAHGYVRRETLQYHLYLPPELIPIVLKFIGAGILTFEFKDAALTAFLNRTENGVIVADRVQYPYNPDVTFDCSLNYNDGDIEFVVKNGSLPDNILNVAVYYELRCELTQTVLKESALFTSDKTAGGWMKRKLSMQACQNAVDAVQDDNDGQQKRLVFECKIDVLRLQFRKNAYDDDDVYCKESRTREMKMSRVVDYEWNIEPNVIAEWTADNAVDHGVYYSPDFDCDQNWCLQLFRFGDNVCVLLRLLRLAFGVGTIEIEFTLSCGIKSKRKKNFLSYNDTATFYKLVIPNTEWMNENDKQQGLKILCHIEIIAVYTDSLCDLIEQDKWAEYGVVV